VYCTSSTTAVIEFDTQTLPNARPPDIRITPAPATPIAVADATHSAC